VSSQQEAPTQLDQDRATRLTGFSPLHPASYGIDPLSVI